MLNQDQKAAVSLISGPLRIIAGPGSGKTTTLIERTKNIVFKSKVASQKVLILTFSHKAAVEIEERLRKESIFGVLVMTFHALAALLLRQFWNGEFLIIDQNEQETILAQILAQSELEQMNDVISDLQSLRESMFFSTAGKIRSSFSRERLMTISKAYDAKLESINGLDFLMLLTKLIWLWQINPQILSSCQMLFSYVMVDEYQDVNPLQIEMVRQIAQPHQNVCVVGDPDQTIYSWRGSDPRSLIKFKNIYAEAKTLFLSANYRNPSSIAYAAKRLISHNRFRLDHDQKAVSERLSEINLWNSADEWEFNEIIKHLLESCFGSHSHMHEADRIDSQSSQVLFSFSEVVFLYRFNSIGQQLAHSLTKLGYPFQLSLPAYFWMKPVVKHFLRELEIEYSRESTSGNSESFIIFLKKRIEGFSKIQSTSELEVRDLLHLLNFGQLFLGQDFRTSFRSFLDLSKTTQEADNSGLENKIQLMTFHATKGLEFSVVIIVGLEEGILPLNSSLKERFGLEEERRLLYVGMTRAKEELHLISTQKVGQKAMAPSRFLNEIGLDHLKERFLPQVRKSALVKKRMKKAQMKMF